MEPSQLKPYISIIIARAQAGNEQNILVDDILNDLMECLAIRPSSERQLVQRIDAYPEGELQIGLLYYREQRQTTWTFEPTILDTINQLAVVCKQRRYVAIYLSDSSRKYTVTNAILNAGNQGFSGLELIPQGTLNTAFVCGPARTLWLSGTHRRTSIKADNKILSGINLRDALDPLGDQTYYFTASRCMPDTLKMSQCVGVSPRKSQVWIGMSRNWVDFLASASTLLCCVEDVKTSTPGPIPIVAIPSLDASTVKCPFDIAIVPPELLADDPSIDSENREEMELWGYQSNFEIVQAGDSSMISEVSLRGIVLGKIKVDLSLALPVSWEVTGLDCVSGQEEAFAKALALMKKRAWVKIWFESGHTISDGEIFEVRHRDVPFNDIIWANLGGFDVSKEKPTPLNAIGTQYSLFDWMQLHFPNYDKANLIMGGWLASDDGSMEIADFIHLSENTNPPTLTLVHVKGSGSKDPSRQISVSDYEVVTSQAVKNLRYLDRLLLQDGLAAGIGKKIGNLVWHDRAPSTRDEMITALANIGVSYQRRVIVLQPRIIKTVVSQARQKMKSADYARLRQLDTLLLSAAASCKSLGVEFKVIGEDI